MVVERKTILTTLPVFSKGQSLTRLTVTVKTYPTAMMIRCCVTSSQVLLKLCVLQLSEGRSFSAAETPGGDIRNQSQSQVSQAEK